MQRLETVGKSHAKVGNWGGKSCRGWKQGLKSCRGWKLGVVMQRL
jgi:hypothetical protein